MSAESEGQGTDSRWVVVGLSGVTRGGKTSLALNLLSCLPTTTAYLSQDEYILPNSHPAHSAAPEPLSGINKETLASIDMSRMMKDLRRVLAAEPSSLTLSDPENLMDRSQVVGCALQEPRPPLKGRQRTSRLPAVLVLDGFRLFEHTDVLSLCHLRYFLTLTREQCVARGKQSPRTSSFINSPQYFDLCVWPKYEEYLAMLIDNSGADNIRFLDGASPPDALAKTVENEVKSLLGLSEYCS
ncbi:Nicotinamide riboside kinase 2 [Portunus trituberculatus]|uniref:Nicotinamide riboside kinase 2 n=2 Tax=Portunus trituberculatus TaxID=210409 RepID=A0A5B7D0G9_PORTR|nr:Nicotinamide riboside kinase 2 [Portunus trituberculatus]